MSDKPGKVAPALLTALLVLLVFGVFITSFVFAPGVLLVGYYLATQVSERRQKRAADRRAATPAPAHDAVPPSADAAPGS